MTEGDGPGVSGGVRTIYLLGAVPHPSTSLGLQYLRAAVEAAPDLRQAYRVRVRTVCLDEWNPLQTLIGADPSILESEILRDLVACEPSVIGYSLYPWSKNILVSIARQAKSFLPETVQVAGGCSVSGRGRALLEENRCLDAVLEGEAEETFPVFLRALRDRGPVDGIPGITFRKGGGLISASPNPGPRELDRVPSFWSSYEPRPGEAIYYEASRGCRWKCRYCDFRRRQGIRWFSLPRIREDFKRLARLAPRPIYFVDSDLCGDRRHGARILRFLLNETQGLSFGFEMNAINLSAEVIALVCELFARQKLFHLEIGVQTTSRRAGELAGRRWDPERFTANLMALRSGAPGIPFKFNLILGLPGDTEEEFLGSVDFLSRFRPCRILAYPLRVIPGTEVHRDAGRLGLIFDEESPYQVWATREISLDGMIRLRKFAALLALSSFGHPEGPSGVEVGEPPSVSSAILECMRSVTLPDGAYERMDGRLADVCRGFLRRSGLSSGSAWKEGPPASNGPLVFNLDLNT